MSEHRRSPFAAAPSTGTASSQASMSARLPAPTAAPGGALCLPLSSDVVLQPSNHSWLPQEHTASQTAGDSPGADSIEADPLSGLLVQPSAPTQLDGHAQGLPATSLSQVDVNTYSPESLGRHWQQEAAVPALLPGEAASLGQQQEQVAAAPTQLQRSQQEHQEVPASPQLPVTQDGAERRDDHHTHSEDDCLPEPAAASSAPLDSWLVACRRTHAACPIPAGARERSGCR